MPVIAGEGGPRWFETAFGPLYLDIYGHRDEPEAEAVVELLVGSLPLAGAHAPVLDIGCGAGRHLAALRRRGLEPIGLDLSPHLLRHAGTRAAGRVVRGDMRRLPFRDGVFGAAISMFTSFGYFPDPADNRAVLGEAHRVTGPGGGIALDYFNRPVMLAGLVPESTRTLPGCRVVERRRMERGPAGLEWVVKTVEIHRDGQPTEVVREEVAALSPAELRRLLEEAGFEIVTCLGDYQGTPFEPARSPRCLLVGRRVAP